MEVENKTAEETGFTKATELQVRTVEDEQARYEKELKLWLALPMRIRPLEFVPGRNRREKRTFRKLASQQERGTISRGRARFDGRGRDGGNEQKLQAMYASMRLAGVVEMSKVPAADGGEKENVGGVK